MSDDYDVLHREIHELRRMRAELRLKAHFGHMDVREPWDDLEKRWNQLEANAKHLTREPEDTLAGVADVVRDAISELHEGYDRLASRLRGTPPASLWDQFRNTFDRLVEGGHRVTERVVGAFEELGDTAKVRIEKARLERILIKKCAELGARVYELAKGPLLDGRPPQVLEDNKVKALLQEVGTLNADFQKAAAELFNPGRAEA